MKDSIPEAVVNTPAQISLYIHFLSDASSLVTSLNNCFVINHGPHYQPSRVWPTWCGFVWLDLAAWQLLALYFSRLCSICLVTWFESLVEGGILSFPLVHCIQKAMVGWKSICRTTIDLILSLRLGNDADLQIFKIQNLTSLYRSMQSFQDRSLFASYCCEAYHNVGRCIP
jgi:hypothetical protein